MLCGPAQRFKSLLSGDRLQVLYKGNVPGVWSASLFSFSSNSFLIVRMRLPARSLEFMSGLMICWLGSAPGKNTATR